VVHSIVARWTEAGAGVVVDLLRKVSDKSLVEEGQVVAEVGMEAAAVEDRPCVGIHHEEGGRRSEEVPCNVDADSDAH